MSSSFVFLFVSSESLKTLTSNSLLLGGNNKSHKLAAGQHRRPEGGCDVWVCVTRAATGLELTQLQVGFRGGCHRNTVNVSLTRCEGAVGEGLDGRGTRSTS